MILNCEKVAQSMKDKLKDNLKNSGLDPELALIKVGNDHASSVYVRGKERACEEVGIKTRTFFLDESVTTDDVIMQIQELNNDDDVNGILLQLPLPDHIDERGAINAISPIKDVDCLSATSVGCMMTNEDLVTPCTPDGIMRILSERNVKLEGRNVLIINRSMLVGKPLVELMQRENATVTLAHSKTGEEQLKVYMAIADVIVTAVGKPNFINKKTISEYQELRKESGRPPQIIIDVSMNRDENGKLCGDVNKELYEEEGIFVTPVPKGVGLTTVAALLENTAILATIQNLL